MLPLNEEQKKEVLRRIERSATFQRVFRGKDGEFVQTELKKQLKGFDPDPYIHAYNAGQQSVITFIENTIEADVEKAREVLKESAESKER